MAPASPLPGVRVHGHGHGRTRMVNGCATGQDGWTCVGSANCGSKCGSPPLLLPPFPLARTRVGHRHLTPPHLFSFHRFSPHSLCNTRIHHPSILNTPPPLLDSATSKRPISPRY